MLAPDNYFDSVHDVNYEALHSCGIRGIIFDIDNTLTAFDAKLPPDEVNELIKRLQGMGFAICLCTNNTNKRLNGFNEHLQLPGIANAAKPLKRGILRAMKIMGTKKDSTVIIGDQLLSDVWAGKNARIMSIMVKPTTERDFFFVKFKRFIERIMMKKFFESYGKK